MQERARVERKISALVSSRFWPPEQKLRYRAWLNNFREDEVSAASKILDQFVYIDRDHAERALRAGYCRLLGHLADVTKPVERTADVVRSIHECVYFTPVRGERPRPTDSGFAYARFARDTLCAADDRTVDTGEAFDAAKRGNPVVLVDDFCGSGNQVLDTLSTPVVERTSMLDLLQGGQATIGCVTAVMTDEAITNIRRITNRVLLFPGYVVHGSEYSVDVRLPYQDHQDVHDLLSSYCDKLVVPSYIDPIRGFHELGLMLGVHDAIPDASLPIFWASGGGWTPLMGRT